jgi:chromosome partitioning protein
MLDWLKRKTAAAPREQLVENENRAPSTEEKVERLVVRLGGNRRTGDETGPESSDTNEAPGSEVSPVSEVSAVSEAAAVAEVAPVNETATAPEVLPTPETVPVPKVAPPRDVSAVFAVAAVSEVAPAPEVPGRSEPPRVHELARVSSPTRVIAVAAQKGGAGKTTIAAHLAVQANALGQGPVVLADTDPQGSLGQWWRARNDESLALATLKLEDVAANPAALRNRGAALAIIDTPPALTGSIEQVIALADLIIIPARPSPHDLRAVGATVEMTRRAGKPFLFVVNGAAPRANITAEAVAALSEHGRVAPVILYQRTDYAASMIDGRTVMETATGGRSAQEIAELWNYVLAQISVRQAA